MEVNGGKRYDFSCAPHMLIPAMELNIIDEKHEGHEPKPRLTRYASAPLLHSRPKPEYVPTTKTTASAPSLRSWSRRLREQREKKRTRKMLDRFWSSERHWSPIGPKPKLEQSMNKQWISRMGAPEYRREIRTLKRILLANLPDTSTTRKLPAVLRRQVSYQMMGRKVISATSITAEFVFLVETALVREVWDGMKTYAIFTAHGISTREDIRRLVVTLGTRILSSKSDTERMLRCYLKRGHGFSLNEVFKATTLIRDAVGPLSSKLRTSLLLSIQIVKALLLIPQIVDGVRDVRGTRINGALNRVLTKGKLENLFSLEDLPNIGPTTSSLSSRRGIFRPCLQKHAR
ncbi:hypothetical protein AAMO2058_000168800 [Amorphochlora amoebiformis]